MPQGNESVYALTLENNNGTFEVMPAVIDRRNRFTIMVRNNRLLDFENRPSVRFEVEYCNYYLCDFFFFFTLHEIGVTFVCTAATAKRNDYGTGQQNTMTLKEN